MLDSPVYPLRAVFRDEGMVPALVEGIKMYQLDTTGPDQYQPIAEETIRQVLNWIAIRRNFFALIVVSYIKLDSFVSALVNLLDVMRLITFQPC